MFGLTPAHLVLILIIALIVVGPGKLPEVGAAMGKSIREFQKASSSTQEAVTGAFAQPTPQGQVAPPPAQASYSAQPTAGVGEVGPVQPAAGYGQPNGAMPPASPSHVD